MLINVITVSLLRKTKKKKKNTQNSMKKILPIINNFGEQLNLYSLKNRTKRKNYLVEDYVG